MKDEDELLDETLEQSAASSMSEKLQVQQLLNADFLILLSFKLVACDSFDLLFC